MQHGTHGLENVAKQSRKYNRRDDRGIAIIYKKWFKILSVIADEYKTYLGIQIQGERNSKITIIGVYLPQASSKVYRHTFPLYQIKVHKRL